MGDLNTYGIINGTQRTECFQCIINGGDDFGCYRCALFEDPARRAECYLCEYSLTKNKCVPHPKHHALNTDVHRHGPNLC
jgi:hypothetical protein